MRISEAPNVEERHSHRKALRPTHSGKSIHAFYTSLQNPIHQTHRGLTDSYRIFHSADHGYTDENDAFENCLYLRDAYIKHRLCVSDLWKINTQSRSSPTFWHVTPVGSMTIKLSRRASISSVHSRWPVSAMLLAHYGKSTTNTAWTWLELHTKV